MFMTYNTSLQVLLWHYPDSNLAPVVVKTPHLANIFGVRFLPCSGNRRLVTGAMDCSVQLHILDAAPSTHARAKRERNTVRWVPDETNEPISSHSTKYLCHSKRVKVILQTAVFLRCPVHPASVLSVCQNYDVILTRAWR